MLGPQCPEARLGTRSGAWCGADTQKMSFQEPKHLLFLDRLFGRPCDGRGQGPFISDRPGYLFAANSREEVVSQAAGVELQPRRGPGRGRDGLERAARTPCAGPPAAPCLSFSMWRVGTVIAPTLQAVLRIQEVK